MSNVVPFRRPEPQAPAKKDPRERETRARATNRRYLKADREIVCAVIEEHLGNLERAALIIGHSLQRQRTLLEELKAMEGGTGASRPPPLCSGMPSCSLTTSFRS